MAIDLFRKVVDEDSDLNWYEDVDAHFKQRQKEREIPAWRIGFVFNYVPRPGNPEFTGSFLEGRDDIIVRVFHSSPKGLSKLKEIANKLDANLYKV